MVELQRSDGEAACGRTRRTTRTNATTKPHPAPTNTPGHVTVYTAKYASANLRNCAPGGHEHSYRHKTMAAPGRSEAPPTRACARRKRSSEHESRLTTGSRRFPRGTHTPGTVMSAPAVGRPGYHPVLRRWRAGIGGQRCTPTSAYAAVVGSGTGAPTVCCNRRPRTTETPLRA